MKNNVIFGGVDFSKYGLIVESAEYEDLSIDLITLPRALMPDEYFGRKRNIKEVTIITRYKPPESLYNPQNIDYTLSHIISLLYSKEKTILRINDLICDGVLIKAKKDIVGYTGYLELVFANFDGLFYFYDPYQFNLNSYQSVILHFPVEKALIKINPTSERVTVSHGSNRLTITGATVGREIVIDLKNKTTMSGGRHLNVDLPSNYFKIKNTSNERVEVNCTGGTGKVIFWRPVSL